MSDSASPSADIDALLRRLHACGLQPAANADGDSLRWQGLHLGDASTDIELNACQHPLAQQYGFMLFVGCTPALREQARPLLDALAPLPGAWLWCGPRGSARFCRAIFDTLAYINGPLLSATLGSATPLPDWQAFFREQQTLAQHLLALARRYRHAQHDDSTPDLAALLQEFARPPHLHSHYALTLARLLELGLSQQQAMQDVFSRLQQASAP